MENHHLQGFWEICVRPHGRREGVMRHLREWRHGEWFFDLYLLVGLMLGVTYSRKERIIELLLGPFAVEIWLPGGGGN